VTKAFEQADDGLSSVEFGLRVDALEQDLGTVSDKATLDENRLANVETQTRVLSEAVVAITETAEYGRRSSKSFARGASGIVCGFYR